MGNVLAPSARVTYTRDGEGEPCEVKIVLHQNTILVAPARPGRREGGHRARLEATPEGRAVLVAAKRKLGNILANDGLVPMAALRLQRGLSQQQLADLTGIAQPQLSRIESGQHDIKATTAERLAKALGVGVAEVVEAVLKMRPQPGGDDV